MRDQGAIHTISREIPTTADKLTSKSVGDLSRGDSKQITIELMVSKSQACSCAHPTPSIGRAVQPNEDHAASHYIRSSTTDAFTW